MKVAQSSKGFTLIEILVVMSLTAIITVGLFSGFRAAVNSWRVADSHISKIETERQLINLLHRQLLQAKSIILTDTVSSEFAFSGRTDSIRYLAPLSMSAGSELFLIEFVNGLGNKEGIWGRFGLYQVDLLPDQIFAESEYLLISEDLSIEFAYLFSGTEESASWQDSWDDQVAMPKLVRVSLKGINRDWPELTMRVGQS